MATNEDMNVTTDGDNTGFVVNDENCQKVIDHFVAMTQTDEALAQYWLQDRHWRLDVAVNDFLDHISQQQQQRHSSHKRVADEVAITSSDDDNNSDNDNDCHVVFDTTPRKSSKVSKTTTITEVNSASTSAADDNPEVDTNVKEFGLICWNIDGIDEKNLGLRTESVAKHIKDANALVVFLQEVNATSEGILRQSLPDYDLLTGNSNSVDYYTMTLIHKKYVKVDDNCTIDFLNSVMGRNLLKTKVTIGGVPLCLMNTHLESTKDFAETRVQQLRKAFKEMSEAAQTSTVIFGGDLNLRDSEIQKCGGIPGKVYDVWIKTGARKELEYTWDMTRNDNLQFNGRFKPRLRFDRIFVRPSNEAEVDVIHFGLIGLQRLKPNVCFPSDHWGLLVQFALR